MTEPCVPELVPQHAPLEVPDKEYLDNQVNRIRNKHKKGKGKRKPESKPLL